MGRLKTPLIYLSILIALIVVSGERASAIEHHVVGDNNGWDSSSDLDSWSSSRLFKVGDIIWFTYNFTGQESVVELGSIEELSSCELSNPIKMYTDGLNKVPLDGEGARFFASGNSESCKNGLKIHVNVHPKEEINSEAGNSPDQESPPTHPPPPEAGPDEDSPPTPKPKPKPKPKRSPPPPYVLPDDESPPTDPPPPEQESPPTHPPPPEAVPDEDSPPTPKPKPKPKPKRSPPPPDVGPDDDSPPTPKPKPLPPPSSTSTMLDGCLFSMVLALLMSYLVKL